MVAKHEKRNDDAKKIDVFQNRCLRRIMKIKWQDKISNRELLERANVERLSEEVGTRRWRFIGHILRQQPDNDWVTALTWTLEGKRKRGRPKTTWRRTVEKERSNGGVAVLKRGVHGSARQESMDRTCRGPMRQLGARGQIAFYGDVIASLVPNWEKHDFVAEFAERVEDSTLRF
ncbi:hypothetical protein ACROYT_G038424 [Oculina patagonica]